MKEIIFNTPGNNLRLSNRFIYCVNPEDYVTLTRELRRNGKLFYDTDRFTRALRSRGSIGSIEEDRLIKYSRLLNNYKNIKSKSGLRAIFSEILKDFETYKYFYKEVGASLKFNPLSRSDAGKHILDKLLFFLEKYINLISPKILFRNIEIKPAKNGIRVVGTNIHFENKKLKIFSNNFTFKESREISPEDLHAENVIVYAVTIGPGIDDEVKHLTTKGEVFDAYLLNGIGAGAAEMVANDLNRYLNDLNTASDYEYKRLSPGYGDWNVSDQTKIFKLLNPEKYIGVRLTGSHIMLPEKSTSGIMGLTLKKNS